MNAAASVLRSYGHTYRDLAIETGYSVQYISMQLNGRRRLTDPLRRALYLLLPERKADEIIEARGT